MKITRRQLRRIIKEAQLNEGVYDPGIFKAVFMAGGPGSGKSYTARSLFGGVRDAIAAGTASGLKLVNSDPAFEHNLKKMGIDPRDLADMSDEEFDALTIPPDSPRGRAKRTRNAAQAGYVEGRLGLVIDGTGDDYEKIKKKKGILEALGYDAYMVFVNTSEEVALERNRKRDRVLRDDMVSKIWGDVQENLGRFQGLFGAENIVIVDNTVYGPIPEDVQKAVDKFVRAPVKNYRGKQWIAAELKKKDRTRPVSEGRKTKLTRDDLKKIVAEEAAKLAEAPNIPDVMGAMGAGKFRPRHEVIEVVDGEMGDVLFFSDRPVQISADGPLSRPDGDIGEWNDAVRDLNLRPEDITDTLTVQRSGHSMYELSHDEFSKLEADLGKTIQREGAKIKITKNQLRRIIKEAIDVIDRDTGEAMRFSDDSSDSMADLPEKAWPDLVKRLGLNPKDVGLDPAGNQGFELDQRDFMRLDNETRGKNYDRKMKKASDAYKADRERLNIDNLLEKLRHWAEDAASDYMADNPGTDLQDIAYDLADAWQFAFEEDEKEELLWHFDGDLNDLKIYAAESMG